MKYILIILSLILLANINMPVKAQYINVKIDENSLGGYGPCEPSIFVNPSNPRNIVAGAVLDRVYYSMDGGKTWTANQLKSQYGVFGDPCITADFKGNFYFFHLADPAGKGRASDEWLDRMVCHKSLDGGKSWIQDTFTGFNAKKDQDKEWAVVNPKNNHIYLSWTQFDLYNSKNPTDSSNILFSKSENAGKTWSEAIRINQFGGDCLDDDLTVEGAVPAAGPKGEIYVAWSLNEKIYFDKSLDGGKSWLNKDIEVVTQPGGWAFDIPGTGRANGLPITACDISKGKYKGAIYINWSDQRNGENDTDIWLSKSTDGGKTWSKALRVNDDSAGKQQFFNWMTVDPITGYIYIVFYDRRNYEDNQTDVYLAYSTDGGNTFVNEKISENPFTPNTTVFFGDYNNISAYNGIVRPIWTRLEGRTLSVWTALIDKK